MNSLEQYLRSSKINQKKELYKDEGKNREEDEEYIPIKENGNDNCDSNQDLKNQQEEVNSSKPNNDIEKTKDEIENENNNDIIQGINSIKNIEKEINDNKEEELFDNEDINNIVNEKNGDDYLDNYIFNFNKKMNVDQNTANDLMNELLFKIQKIKEERTKLMNEGSNEINNVNDYYNILNKEIGNLKMTKTNKEFKGKINIKNKLFQTNPKMKELFNLLKEYNKEKNEKDKMEINFYDNNQINIMKPEVFFNNRNNIKFKNIEYYNKNYEKKHYISAIDGKAIIKGQRININSGLQLAQNSLSNKQNIFNDCKINRFYFNNDKFLEKRNEYNNNDKGEFCLDNREFKRNDYNIIKNENLNFKFEKAKSNEFKKIGKNNFLSKDYYNEELNKINDTLFNNENNLNRLKK